MIENNKFDSTYLRNSNNAAASNGTPKEPTFSNATWLAKLNADGTPGKWLYGSDLGISKIPAADGTTGHDMDPLIALVDGVVTSFNPYDTTTPVVGIFSLLPRSMVMRSKALCNL